MSAQPWGDRVGHHFLVRIGRWKFENGRLYHFGVRMSVNGRIKRWDWRRVL